MLVADGGEGRERMLQYGDYIDNELLALEGRGEGQRGRGGFKGADWNPPVSIGDGGEGGC